MSTKMLTRSVQFHPEVWEFLQTEAKLRDTSTAHFIRECVESYIKRGLMDYFHEEVKKEIVEKKIPEEKQLDYHYARYETNLIQLIRHMKQLRSE